MPRPRHPGVSEILSALVVIGATAAAASMLYVVAGEQAMDADDHIRGRAETDRMRASELLAVSHVSCAGASLEFLLHNYGDGAAHASDFALYSVAGNGDLGNVTGQFRPYHLGGGDAVVIGPMSSVVIRNNTLCGDGHESFALYSPAGEAIILGVPGAG